MKREALDHPKLHQLADLFARSGADSRDALALATGALERLWGWTAKHCPDGRIGRYPSVAIARGCAWLRDPEALLAALVSARWVDGAGEQLVVHDWPQHADKHVHRALVRRLEHFADGSAPRLSEATEAERAKWASHFAKSGDPGEAPAGVEPERERKSQSQSHRTVAGSRARNQEAAPPINGHGGSHSRPLTAGEDDLAARVADLRERIWDRSGDDRNLRMILTRLPEDAVELAVGETRAAARDGHAKNPPGYFVRICRRRASELGIRLGLHREGPHEAPR